MLEATTVEEVAGLAAAVAAELARVHLAGRAHGAVGPDAVRVASGRVELLPAPPGVGPASSSEDVAALGRLLAAALQDVGLRRGDRRCAEALARVAAAARRATVSDDAPTAADVVALIVRAVPEARLPRSPKPSPRPGVPRSPTGTRPPAASERRAVARLVAVAGVLAVVTVALVRAGEGALAAPPAHDVGRWVATTHPATVAAAVLRLVALGCASYLLTTTALGLIVRAVGLRRAAHAVDAASIPAVRRLVAAAVSASVTGHAVLSAAPPPHADAEPTSGAVPHVSRLTVPETGTLSLESERGPEPSAQAPPAQPEREWTIRPGEHLWAIAEALVAEANGGGGAPPPAQTDPTGAA